MKDKVLFVAILGLAITGVSFAIADPFDLPIVFAQVSEEKTLFEQGQDYTTYQFVNGTFQQRTHYPYFETETGNFIPYRLIENSDIIQIEVNEGKYVFDKSTGGLTTFVNGTETIQSDSYIVRSAELDTDNWFDLDVNQSPVTVFVSEQNFEDITITVRKQNDEGIFDIDFFIKGINLKGTAKFTNSIYPNHKFAFTETLNLVNPIISLNGQEIDIRNYVGQTFPRQVLEENMDLILEIQDMFYNSGLGFDNLWSVGIFEDNKIALDYANVEQTQTEIGQTVELDPSLTIKVYNSSSYLYSHWQHQGSGYCHSLSSFSSGGTTTTPYLASNTSKGCRYQAMPFYFTSVPDGSTITSYTAKIYVRDDWGSSAVYRYAKVSDSFCTNTYGTSLDALLNEMGSGGTQITESGAYNTWYWQSITGLSISDMNAAASVGGDNLYCVAFGAVSWNNSGAYLDLKIDNGSSELVINYTVPPPDNPTGLSITQDTAGELDLSWTQTGTVTGFKIERSLDNSSWTTLTADTGTTATTYTDTGLNPNTLYYYRVFAYNSGTSLYSTGSTSSSQTTWDYPQQVTGLTATNGDPISLSWTAPASDDIITGYKLYRDTNYIKTVTGTSTTDAPPNYGQTYSYTVSAVSGVGEGSQSASADGVRGSPPDPPTGVSTSINNPNPNPFDITVSWSAPANVGSGTLSGFEIYRDASLVTTVGLVTSYTDTVSGIGTYTYTVRAVTNHGTSTDSNSSQISTPIEPDAPSLSLAINNPDPNPLDITVSFTEGASNGGSSVTGYNLYSSPDDITYTLRASAVTTSQTITVANVGTWYFKAEAINNAGTSALSTSYNITTPNSPDPPTLGLAINDPDPSPFDITVSFTPPTNTGGSAITGYNLYSSPDDSTYTLRASAVTTSQTITVANEGTWYFKAESINNAGTGSLSISYSITTPTVPDAPTTSTAINDPDNLPFDVAVSFTAPANDGGSAITGYNIYSSSDNLSYTLEASNVSTPQIVTVSSAGTWYFKTEAINNVGTGALSSASSINTPSVPDAPQSITLTIDNPNPSPLVVTVSVSPPNNGGSAITGYNIYTSSDDVTYSLALGNVQNPSSVTLANAGLWYFKAEAINNVGTGALSTANLIGTPVEPNAPASVSTSIPNVNTAPSTVVITWTAPTDNGGSALTGYNVYRDASLITSVGSTTLTFTDTDVKTINTQYTYEVKATNNIGEGLGTTSNITTPNTPLAPTLSITTGTTKLTWTTPTSDGTITGYKIYRDSSLIKTTGLVLTYTDMSVLNWSNSYDYEVSAVSTIGEGALSNIVNPTFDTNVDDATAFGTTGTSSIIDWTEPPYFQGNVTSYSVYYSTPYSTNPSTLIGTTGNTYLNLYNQLQYDTNYAFMVLVNSPLGNTSVGNVVNATTTENLGIVTFDPTTGSDWFDIDAVNQEELNLTTYTRTEGNGGTLLGVTYPTNYESMTCDINYRFGQETLQYTEGEDITATPIDAAKQLMVFQFNNQDSEVIYIECADQSVPNSASSYTLTTTFGNFPLLTQIDNFRSGQYGTEGLFGSLDLITLFVVIISMVGFNRVSPIAGVIIGVSALLGMAYFEITSLPATLIGVFALIAFLAWGVTRK